MPVRLRPTTGERVGSLEHEEVRAVAYSPDGSTLVSTGGSGSLLVWKPGAEEPRIALPGHTGVVWCVTFHADGRLLASGGDDGTVRIWDVVSRRSTLELVDQGSVQSLAFSHDGRLLAAGSYDRARLVVWK